MVVTTAVVTCRLAAIRQVMAVDAHVPEVGPCRVCGRRLEGPFELAPPRAVAAHVRRRTRPGGGTRIGKWWA
jgi:hypothetical protein